MNALLLIAIAVGWLTLVFFACAFVHYSQILRRKEVAALIMSARERASEEPQYAAVASIVTGDNKLPRAA